MTNAKPSQQSLSLEEEQRLLRFYVDFFTRSGVDSGDSPNLADGLKATADRIRSIWDMAVSVGADTRLEPEPRVRHVNCRLVQEAAVNARRHGGATTVEVSVAVDGRRARIEVADDGHGFAFQGRWDHEKLVAERRGPMSLRRRMEDLRGTLSIDSRADGSTLEMEFPLEPRAL